MATASPQPVFAAAPAPGLVRTSAFTLEFDFLLACCDMTTRQQQRVHENLQPNMDWHRVAQLAHQHRVIPHLNHATSACASGGLHIPLQELQALYEASSRQSLWLTAELFRILAHLEANRIEALPYKGPVLSSILYDDVARRQFSDLDLLVRPEDLPKTLAAVAELGYQPSLKLAPREARAYEKSGYEYTFDSPHGRTLLEIKWQILPRFYSVGFDIRDFFDRSVVTRIAGHTLRTLSPEDLLAVLCVHAAKHAWEQISWLCDVVELARCQPLHWPTLNERARGLGIQRMVAVTFLLGQRLLGAPPPPLLEKDRAADGLVHQIVAAIASGTEYDIESAAYFRLMIKTRERWRDRARFLWRLGLTPSTGEWSAVRLPGPLFPLYRAVRVCRVAKRLL